MTDAINAKSEALEQHELFSEELDAVSGGDKATAALIQQAKADALQNAQQALEDKKAGDQIKAFQQLLQEL